MKQRGAALIILVVILAIVLTAMMVAAEPGAGTTTEQEQQTIRALSIAREALIAYAVSVHPDSSAKRPGDLPCPDLDNDGDAETTCSSPSQRIGRLPVETLELQDLVDGYGERLWYALSGTFDRSTVNQCPVPGEPTTISPPSYSNCLNSETGGTITVRSPTGAMLNDGTSIPGAAIAVVFSAGPVLTRQGAASAQDRGCTGDANVAACESTGVCSDKLGTTARCNPVNYLDIVSGGGLPSEDNKDFTDNSTTDGFIQGPVRDTNGQVVVNDRLLVLRYVDLMPHLEQRVAREALRCLQDYALDNGGNYPWAAPISANYATTLLDQSGELFGRLPNSMPASGGAWRVNCPLDMVASGHEWWANWSNLVFYGVAPDFAPGGTGMCGTCLTVDPPGGAPHPIVVLVAGSALPTLVPPQARGVGMPASNYLEDGNEAGTGAFTRAARSATFNDLVLF